jgi:hypothetical protein
MKRSSIVLSALLAMGAASALAAPITLTFTGLKDNENILNFYNGGTGSDGSSGTNYGISFGPDALAIISDQDGGTGNTSSIPPPATTTVAYFLTGAGDIMNVAAGFKTGFSFYYAAAFDPGSVEVFSGLNGTGTLLETLTLPVNGSLCDGKTDFSCWTNTGVAFSGTAESVDFTGTANQIAFADITLGASSVPTTTPEPSSILLLGSGLVGIAGLVRRKLMA